MVMADDENSDFVGNAAEQKVIKGTAANSLSGYHRSRIEKDRGLSATWEIAEFI
jgi:hypothetical protein